MGKISSLPTLLACLFLTLANGKPAAAESQVFSDTVFLAIDLTNVMIAGAAESAEQEMFAEAARPCGVEPTPWIVWENLSTGAFYAWIMTLDGVTGAQKGDRLEVPLPGVGDVADILWVKNFTVPLARGIEPVPWIVDRNHKLFWFPVTYGADGTPAAGAISWASLPIGTEEYGYAECLAEIPGSEFYDGAGRLFIGTTAGFIAVVKHVIGVGLIVDAIAPVSTNPIVDMEPIPQYNYIALGILTNNAVHGYEPSAFFTGGPAVFTLTCPGEPMVVDFDVFGPNDAPLGDPVDSVKMVLADGTSELALASIGALESGSRALNLMLDTHSRAIRRIATGSLLMLADDGSQVEYDPAYSPDSGWSGCDVTITDDEPDICGYTCGDANGDGMVNVGDAVFMVGYVFKGGAAPDPIQAGDANCDGDANVGDAVYLISYVFRGGSAPCCP